MCSNFRTKLLSGQEPDVTPAFEGFGQFADAGHDISGKARSGLGLEAHDLGRVLLQQLDCSGFHLPIGCDVEFSKALDGFAVFRSAAGKLVFQILANGGLAVLFAQYALRSLFGVQLTGRELRLDNKR